MGVIFGIDAVKSGKNTHLVAVMRVRLLQKIGLLNLRNWTRFKKGNVCIICTKSVRDYWGMSLMLPMWFIFYWHTNVDLLRVLTST